MPHQNNLLLHWLNQTPTKLKLLAVTWLELFTYKMLKLNNSFILSEMHLPLLILSTLYCTVERFLWKNLLKSRHLFRKIISLPSEFLLTNNLKTYTKDSLFKYFKSYTINSCIDERFHLLSIFSTWSALI